jgi:hypothetical protein
MIAERLSYQPPFLVTEHSYFNLFGSGWSGLAVFNVDFTNCNVALSMCIRVNGGAMGTVVHLKDKLPIESSNEIED